MRKRERGREGEREREREREGGREREREREGEREEERERGREGERLRNKYLWIRCHFFSFYLIFQVSQHDLNKLC